jgi:hypothetical protein
MRRKAGAAGQLAVEQFGLQHQSGDPADKQLLSKTRFPTKLREQLRFAPAMRLRPSKSWPIAPFEMVLQ